MRKSSLILGQNLTSEVTLLDDEKILSLIINIDTPQKLEKFDKWLHNYLENLTHQLLGYFAYIYYPIGVLSNNLASKEELNKMSPWYPLAYNAIVYLNVYETLHRRFEEVVDKDSVMIITRRNLINKFTNHYGTVQYLLNQ